MKLIKHIDQQLLSHINALNTVNGGMAAPKMKYLKRENGYTLTVRVPSTNPEGLHAEVVNNFLFIYQVVNAEGETEPNTRVIGKIPINFDINIPTIEAHFKGETLHVELPFNDLNGGYRKKLTF